MKRNAFIRTVLGFACCHITLTATAAIVSFGFSGTMDYIDNPSNSLPANITLDAPFSGIVTYDTTAVLGGAGVDSDFQPDSGAYYFNTNGGFWLSLSVAGHRFDCAPASPGDAYADVIIYNFAVPQDVFWIDASAPTIRMDGVPLPGPNNLQGFRMRLYDNTGTAYTSDLLPVIPPNLAAFTHLRNVNIDCVAFHLSGTLTEIGVPRPVLAIRPQAGPAARLSWPTAARGFKLLQNTNLTSGIGWQTNGSPIIDTATEHTVTTPLAGSMYYRLKTP